MWFRVFGSNLNEPAPADLLAHMQGRGYAVRGHFRGDDQGWFQATLALDDEEEEPLELQRYLATEEGIRGELNTWAAWLETQEGSPHAGPLMQRMIATTQLFTLQCPPELPGEACVALCRFLADQTAGVYQIDGQGFFAADGTLLVKEEAVA
jgi:hypothetical protein